MRLTKLGHSCVRLEKDGATIVIDPGIWSGTDPLAGADVVLITHEHADHLDESAVRAALARPDGPHLWTNQGVAEIFADQAARVHAIARGDTFTVSGFDVTVYGRDHAVIHPDIPAVANVGFAIDGKLFHPGDALTVPGEEIEVLLLPVSAPWLKAAEIIDYAREVKPRTCYPIHDEVLSVNGMALIDRLASALLGGTSSYTRVPTGESVAV
jgi:L-ascorbate metabolism protein UlaG (beta-lactamase superfamily)